MTDEVVLIYDGECPICQYYSLKVQIEESVGSLRLVNAREPSPDRDKAAALGLDIDQGMLLKLKGQFYYGSDAIYILTRLGVKSSLFGRLSYLFFGSRVGARLFYPVVKFLRSMLLRMMGKGRID